VPAVPNASPAAPLDEDRLRAAAIVPGGHWTQIRVLAATGSTNADLLEQARSAAPDGLVLATEDQTAGRGRQGRSWRSLPGGALTFSALLRPSSVPAAARGWLPLLTGVAVTGALREVAGVDARLKWPNDVLAGAGKLAGILAEQAADAVVVGIGLNVRGQAADLGVETATSLELLGARSADRTELMIGILGRLEHWYLAWRRADGDAAACGLRTEYLRLSATIRQRVRVEFPGGRQLHGTAVDVDGTGRLLVSHAAGETVAVSAGDVIHLR
jgi:BirA family transcriptional regulator, biotin operon repressor / biotin---[acetyl-CoA-carboxylase] ligase